MRVAAVSFLNTWPLIAGLADEPGVSVVTALPSALPQLLEEDAADVALLPVFAYLAGTGAALVPGAGIGARGPVDSVKLFARRPPQDLRTILVDRGSRTSVALLDVLLREQWGVTPTLVSGRPRPEAIDDHEGVLAIGDACFAVDRATRTTSAHRWQAHDLGALWFAATGRPFVFAAWTLGEGYVARSTAAERARLADLLGAARDRGRADIDALAELALAAGKCGVGGDASRDAICYYLRNSLHFDLGPDEFQGIRYFRGLCTRHGLLEEARPLDLLGPGGGLTRDET